MAQSETEKHNDNENELIEPTIMRQVLFILLAFVATTAAAQVQLSFDVGGSYKAYRYTEGGLAAMDGTLPAGGEGHLTIRAGYAWGRVVGAGLLLGGGYSSYTFTDGLYNPNNGKWEESATTIRNGLTLSGGIYLRLAILHKGPWSVYAELSALYDRLDGMESRSEQRVSGLYPLALSRNRLEQNITARISPLLCYSFSPHWSADLRLDWVALTLLHTRATTYPWLQEGDVSSDAASETQTTQVGMGAHLLPNSGIALGFSYLF